MLLAVGEHPDSVAPLVVPVLTGSDGARSFQAEVAMSRAAQDLAHPVEELLEVGIGETIATPYEQERPRGPHRAQTGLSQLVANHALVVAQVHDYGLRVAPVAVDVEQRVARLESRERNLLGSVLQCDRNPS